MGTKKTNSFCLRSFFLLRFVCLAACPQFCKFALLATCSARGLRDDIDNDFSVVFATLWTCAVSHASSATLTLRETLTRNSVVTPPLRGLGTILAHSDYHGGRIIQTLNQRAISNRTWSDVPQRDRSAL